MGISLDQLKGSLQRTKKYIDDKVVFSAPQIDPSTKNWILSGTDTGVSASVTAESTKLDYGMFTFAEDAPEATPVSTGDILPFSTKKIGTIEINPDTHGILLKKDKVYFMRCNADIAGASGLFMISFINITTGDNLEPSAYRISPSRSDTSSPSDLAIIYKPDEDCEVGVTTTYQSSPAFVYRSNPNILSYLIAMEIGREHVTHPTISEQTGNWVINGTDTGVKAEGTSGVSIQDITKNSENNIVITFTDGTVKNIGNLGYTWDEITGKPSTFQPSAHTHTKSQISDMPTKVSQFSNDAGYITSADVDTSQNHTHTNKAALDKITQSVSDTWNAAYAHVSNKNNPHGVTPAQIGAASASHNHDGTYLKSTDSASDMVVNFDDTSKRENLVAGENIKTSFGKIKKWFSDMKTVAWTGNYNDLTNKPSIENISGIVSVAQGGTGAATASQARVNLGIGTAATQNIANNCTTTTEGYILDARQGKVLMDKANQINSDLGQVNNNLGGCIFETKSDGAYVTYTPAGGADPVTKKLGEENSTNQYNEIYLDYLYSTEYGTITVVPGFEVGSHYYTINFAEYPYFFSDSTRYKYDVDSIQIIISIMSTCKDKDYYPQFDISDAISGREYADTLQLIRFVNKLGGMTTIYESYLLSNIKKTDAIEIYTSMPDGGKFQHITSVITPKDRLK